MSDMPDFSNVDSGSSSTAIKSTRSSRATAFPRSPSRSMATPPSGPWSSRRTRTSWRTRTRSSPARSWRSRHSP